MPVSIFKSKLKSHLKPVVMNWNWIETKYRIIYTEAFMPSYGEVGLWKITLLTRVSAKKQCLKLNGNYYNGRAHQRLLFPSYLAWSLRCVRLWLKHYNPSWNSLLYRFCLHGALVKYIWNFIKNKRHLRRPRILFLKMYFQI